MTHAIAFDTLAYAKKLESCGVSTRQAEGQAEALATILEINFTPKKDLELHKKDTDTQYALLSNKFDQKIDTLENKIDQKIDTLENRIDQKIDSLENRMDQKIDSLESKMDQKIDSLESKMDQKIDSLESKIQQDINHLKIDMIKWVLGIVFTQTALILSV